MMPNVLARLSMILLLSLCLGARTPQGCEVLVQQPWEVNTYIPQDSIVDVSCTGEANKTLTWSIYLPGSAAVSQFSFQESIRILNNQGFYRKESDPRVENSIQLLINSTEGKNGTVIHCVDLNTATRISETSLIVYEPTAVILKAIDGHLQVVNISWIPLEHYWNRNYTLTVTSSNISPQSYQLQVSAFMFRAPEGAPPCEVYNLSVTATYVGATYSGAGCSVPSPVLSRMLPSLPNLTRLNSSLDYKLKKTTSGDVSLTFLLPFKYSCEDYPVINHTLEITRIIPLSDVMQFTLIAEEYNFTAVLWVDAVYTFKVFATNDVGTVYTDNITIYTTDVQTVRVIPSDCMCGSSFRVQCVFITGSDAQGCMVVLVGVLDNVTVNITRDVKDVNVNVTFPIVCYKKVIAFDIELNGEVDILPIPGVLTKSSVGESDEECNQLKSNSKSGEGGTLIVVASLLGLSLAFNMILVIIITSKLCRKQHLLCDKQVAIASVNREVASVNIDHEDNSNSCESTPLDVLYEVITAADDNNTKIETKANEVYGVSTDGIETTPNVVYGVSTDGIEITPIECMELK